MDAFLHMEWRKKLFASVNQRSHLCEHLCLACPLLGVEGKMKGFIDRILSCLGGLGVWNTSKLHVLGIVADFIVSFFALFFRRTSPIIPL